MKTTIDIADELIQQARRIQKRDDITLRALVEDGLRMAMAKHSKPTKPYKWNPVVVGEPYKPGMQAPDMRELLEDANVRPWLAREFEAMRRVAESPEPYPAPKKARHASAKKTKQ